MNTPEGWKHCNKCDTSVDCCLRGCAALEATPTPPEQPGESVCATCGGLVSDPVIVQPAAQGELTDEEITRTVFAACPGNAAMAAWPVPTVAAIRAVIAADRAARAPEIMEAVLELAVLSSDFTAGECTGSAVDAAFAEVERLVRGDKA